MTLTVVGVAFTWTGLGGDANWSTAANWDVGTAPSGGEDLVFPSGAARLGSNNDLSGESFHSIEIDGAGYSIDGNAVAVTDGFKTTYAAGASEFALDTTPTQTGTFDVADGGTLDMSGAITVSDLGAGIGVTKAGGGALKYSGAAANSYNGVTTINAGTLLLAKPDDVVSANGSVIVGDNTVGASLEIAGANQFWVGADVTVNEGSTFDVGAYVERISNPNLEGSTVQIDAGGVPAVFVGVNTFATTNNVTAAIQGLGALQIDNAYIIMQIADDADLGVELRVGTVVQGLNADSGFYKYGSGTVAFSGDNTFGGDVSVGGGAVQVESDHALGDTTGVTTVGSGASIYFSGAGLNFAEDFADVAGSGVWGSNLFRVLSGDATLSGVVDMTGSIQIRAVDGATLAINGVIDDGASTYYVEIINGSTGRTVLGGSNLFDGALYADSGSIPAANDNAFGNPLTPSTISVGTGGSLELGGGITIPSTKSLVLSSLRPAGSSKVVNLAGENTIAAPILIINNNQSFDVAAGTKPTVSGSWSTAANWVGDAAPVAGADLVFGAGAARTTNTNDFASGTAFHSITIAAAGCTLAGNAIELEDGLSATYGSGLSTFSIDAALGADLTVDVGSGGELGVAGVPDGSFHLTKLGAGLLELQGSNTYSGGTTIAAGTLAITNASALGTGTATVGDGAADSGLLEIDLAGVSAVSNTFLFDAPIATGLQVNSGTITFLGGATLNEDLGVGVAAGASLRFAGPISDGGQTRSLTKAGPGALIFSGVNAYTGTTFVDEGLLQLDCGVVCIQGDVTVGRSGSAATVQELQADQIADGAAVDLAGAGAVLDLNGFDDTIGSLSLTGATVTTGAGTLTLASGGGVATIASSQTATLGGNLAFAGPNNVFDVAQGTTSSGVDLSVTAIVSSFANIIKAGAGTMALTGANTYSGGTNINSGVLALGNNTGAGSGVVNILGTATLDLSGGITVANALNVDSSGVAIRNSGGTNTLDGTFNLGVDATIDAAASTTLVISSVVDDSGNGHGLTKTGAGTLKLDAANNYSGVTTVSAGILSISNNGSLGAGDVVNNAEIEIVDNLLLNNDFTINSAGTAFLVDGLSTIQGTVTLLSDLVIDTPGLSNLYLNGVVGGIGFGVTKDGAGTLGLGQANAYTGGTSVNGGFLQLFNAQSTGVAGAVVVGSGATLIQTSAVYSPPSAGLFLNGGSIYLVPLPTSESLTGPITLTGDATFDVASGGSLTVLGNIGAGNASLTKDGDGVMIIEGASSYTGTTFVTAGELVVNGDLSSSSTIDVQTGAVLGGNGALGPIVVGPTSTFSPGNSSDTITAASLTLSPGADYVEELYGNAPGDGATGYDQTVVTAGPVVLNDADLIVNLGGGYTPVSGVVFTVIDNQSIGPAGGTFNGLAEGALVSSGGSIFRISYVGGDGNDVTLTTLFASVTVVSTAPDPSVFGQSVTFTATVTPLGQAGATPTGAVTFLDGVTVLGTSPLDASGVATLTTGAPAVGLHGITAVYSSGGSVLGSTSAVALHGGNPAATSLSLVNAPGSTVFGQSVTFTAIVGVDAPGAGAPTGSVWFLDGQTVLGVATLSQVSGRQTAVFTTSALSTGAHAITAQYSGNSSFLASATQSVSHVVSKSGATATLIGGGTADPSQPATFTATVSAVSPGAGAPTGTATFYDVTTPIGTAPLIGGTAVLTTSALGAGSHEIRAVYSSGDSNFDAGSVSDPVVQVVNASASTLLLDSSPPTSTYGQAVTLTAVVVAADPSAGPVTGFVNFYDGADWFGYAPVEGGVARLSLGTINPGVRKITAVFAGNGAINPSQSTITQVVTPAPTATAVAVHTVQTGWHRSASTLVVTVNALYPGQIPASGDAEIYMSGRLYRTVSVVNGGATLSIPSSIRSRPFTAAFLSNPRFAGSRSGGLRLARAAHRSPSIVRNMPLVRWTPAR